MDSRHSLWLFVVLSVSIHQSVCIFWPWEEKPKSVDGNWSGWSTWSSCQIPSDSNSLPFRYKERDCNNPPPKNGGADCVGETRRTSRCEDCNIPLGMESGRIEDSFVTALDSHEEFPASAARLNGKSAWCSDYPERLPEPLYLQIDLRKMTEISAIATQAFYPAAELMSLRMGRVSKYQLTYSTDGVSWQLYKNSDNVTILSGNKKRNGTVLNVLTPEITARFLRVYPSSYFAFVCMRLELYGCTFGCGGLLTQEPGNIVTEGPPTEDQDCLWSVNLPNTSKIHFDFINFNLPCSNGLVEFRDGDMPYSVAPVLVQYCGYESLPPPVSSDSGKLWVRYKSNASDSQVGFYAVYFPGCGKQLHGSSGDVKSPNFPNEYFHNLKCIWTISVPEGKSAQLQFVGFNVEGDRNRQRCPHDHLTIWNGSDSSAPLIGKYCNSNPPPPIICASGNTLRLKFHSDDALAFTGFHISYQAVDPLAPCSVMSSSVVMPTLSRLSSSNMPLSPTPILMTENLVFTRHVLFPSSHYLVKTSPTVDIGAVSLTSMAPNATFGFTGTSMNGEMQAAARGRQEDDDDEDDSLTTVIILSAFAFVVICMIIASIVPSVKRRLDEQKREKEMNLMLGASLSIPETNSKESFEGVPVAVDDNALEVPDIVTCEASSHEGSLPPVEFAESVSLSETPTVEGNKDQFDTVESEMPIENDVGSGKEPLLEADKDGLNDIEDEPTEHKVNMPIDLEGNSAEICSLKMSYEDLGSSFASEMKAMLSHFAEKDEETSWNSIPSANPENSPQDGDHDPERTDMHDMEAVEIIPHSSSSTQDDTSVLSSEEAPLSSSFSNQEEEQQSLLNSKEADTSDIWEMQPIYVSHSRRRTASRDGVSVPCTDSKHSGCTSSSEKLQPVENDLLYSGDNETSV